MRKLIALLTTMLATTASAQGVIDVHAHLLPAEFVEALESEVIRMMLTITTPDHLLYGSDYPYVAPQVLTQGLARMKQYLTDEPDLAPYKEMILFENAKRLIPNPSIPRR